MFDQVKEVISYSQGIPFNELHLENLEKTWALNKKFFIDLFGGKPILNVGKITVPLSAQQKEEKVASFIEHCRDIDETLGEFLAFCGSENIFQNKVPRNFTLYMDDDDRPFYIPAGIKIGKAISRYFEFDTEEIVNELSMIIQEDKLEGELCFSVHPLDFLSISENNSNWRSCHALDGGYRGGNIDYICDEVTFIAYIKSEGDNCCLPHFPSSVKWNNKKWRTLLFFDRQRGLIWSGRHYPMMNENALGIIFTALISSSKLLDYYPHATSTGGWKNLIVNGTLSSSSRPDLYINLDEDYIYWDGQLTRLRRWIKNGEHTRMYNDLLYSSTYKPYVISVDYHNTIQMNNFPAMEVGKNIGCLCCGKLDYIQFDSSRMICDHCDERFS